jgi:phytoene dehydrogenase-like protein
MDVVSCDVVVLGAGFAGMAAACRLQAQGYSTVVLEAHDKPGGCAGFYQKAGFSFDIGATTLVDFESHGVGGEFLSRIGLFDALKLESLPGYKVWLPDRTLVLHRDPIRWREERARTFGDTLAYQALWKSLDDLAEVFWPAAANGIRLPITSITDVYKAAQTIPWHRLPLVRHIFSSLGGLLTKLGLRQSPPIVGLLSMLCEDTLHARTIDDSPLINAALGTSIRGRLARPFGGMRGFWRVLVDHYHSLGGQLQLTTRVVNVEGRRGNFLVRTKRGDFHGKAVINTIPAPSFTQISPEIIRPQIERYVTRDAASYGSGIVVCMGVPDEEVLGEEHRHHQLLQDYSAPLGNGNNMFISISAKDDELSAPPGFRAVMISTHTNIAEWRDLNRFDYDAAKRAAEQRLIGFARRVYPRLGSNAIVVETGTPRAYAKFARRPDGAVGGVRMNMRNSNQWAMPCDIGDSGIYFAGDYTWPGLGSVACLLSSRIAVEKLIADL